MNKLNRLFVLFVFTGHNVLVLASVQLMEISFLIFHLNEVVKKSFVVPKSSNCV